MKTTDFTPKLSSAKLKENLNKNFGLSLSLENYSREQLEDMRNKLRTRMFQLEGSSGINDLLTNETYQKDKAVLALLNTRIKEMLGEDIAKLRDKLAKIEEAKKGVRAPKYTKKTKGSKGADRDGDGVGGEVDDIQVARMVAGGVPKKKAIAKATSDNVKEAERLPAKQKATTWKDKSGQEHPATKVQGHASRAADRDADKERKAGDKMKESASKCNHSKKGENCPVHGESKCPTSEGKGMPMVKGPKGKMVPKFAADGKGKMEESASTFRRNVHFVNESLAYLLSENEEEKAKAITAAGDIVNDYTSWMQRVGQYQTKSMIELADAIRSDFGAAEAESFKQAVGPALQATLETLMQQREAISNAVAALAGEAPAPTDTMGMEPATGVEEPAMEPTEPDMMNTPADDLAASEPAATGREMRESKFSQKLAESHSIISRLAR